MITTHGDDTYKYRGIRLNFSSNIFQDGDAEGLRRCLATQLHRIAHYPEPEPLGLERTIAEREGVSPQCVVVTNGATEAIYLLAQVFSGSTSAIPQPTFREYEQACRIFGHTICHDGHVTWLCNPNNPTGTVVDEHFGDNRSSHFYILDHAYEDYTLRPLTTDSEAVAQGNIAIIHSMTKQYAIPGLRLGYIVTAQSVAERVREVKQPWSVNALAVAAGEYLLSNVPRSPHRRLLDEAQRLVKRLNEIDGIHAMPTETNFMLCTVEKGTAARLKDFLATRHGILIRDASDFRGLSPHHFRVAAQRPDDDNTLTEAIKDYMQNG